MIISDLYASIFRFCDDFKVKQEALGRALSVVNFDAHADEANLPQGDLIGISGFSATTSTFTSVTVMFGICTQDDTNLFRLVAMISEVYESLKPTSVHTVYDSSTGNARGIMNVVDEIQLLPVSGNIARPLQYIAVQFVTDCFIN